MTSQQGGFPKNHIPWNKGKETGLIPRSAFKKGQIPHNKKIMDYAEISNLYSQGLSAQNIGMLKGVSKTTVLRALEKLKVPRRPCSSTRFKKGQIPHNKKEKVCLFCQLCEKEYYLKPSAAKRQGPDRKSRSKYCSVKCRQESFNLNENFKKKVTKNLIRYLQSPRSKTSSHTKPENEFKIILEDIGLVEGRDFIHQYLFNDKFLCDFAFPKKKVIFEVQGDYFHVNPLKFPYDPETLVMPSGKNLHKERQIKTLNNDKAKFAYVKKCG